MEPEGSPSVHKLSTGFPQALPRIARKRETVMLSMLLVVLFAASALFAVAAIALTWREHGAAILGLPQALRDCPDVRNYRFTLITIQPRMPAPAFRPKGYPSRPVRRAA